MKLTMSFNELWVKESREKLLLVLAASLFAFEVSAFNVQSIYIFPLVAFSLLVSNRKAIPFILFIAFSLLLFFKGFSYLFSFKQALSISLFFSASIILMKILFSKNELYLKTILVSCFISSLSAPFQIFYNNRAQGFYSEPSYLSELLAYVVLPLTVFLWPQRLFRFMGILLLILLPFTESITGFAKYLFVSLLFVWIKGLRRPVIFCSFIVATMTLIAFFLNPSNYAMRHMESVLRKTNTFQISLPSSVNKLKVQAGGAYTNSGYMSDSYIDKVYLPYTVIKGSFSNLKLFGYRASSELDVFKELHIDESVINAMKRIKKSDSFLNSWLARFLALFGLLPFSIMLLLFLRKVKVSLKSLAYLSISLVLLFSTGGNFSNPRLAFVLSSLAFLFFFDLKKKGHK